MQTQILNVWQWTWPAGRLTIPCIRQPSGLGLHYSSTFVLEESEEKPKNDLKKKYLRTNLIVHKILSRTDSKL